MNLVDLVGNQYGLLTVVARDGVSNGVTTWLCSCECGGSKVMRSDVLRKHPNPSCGCADLRMGRPRAEPEVVDPEPAEAAADLNEAMREWVHPA